HLYKVAASDDTFLQVNLASRGVHHEGTPDQARIFVSGKTLEYNYSFVGASLFDADEAMAWSNTQYGAPAVPYNELFLTTDDAGGVTVSANYSPDEDMPADVTLILALYAADGRLIAADRVSASAQPYALSVSLDQGAAARAKAFLWSGAAYTPVLPPKELDLG
ncbi:MAG: hypothetical protein LBF64_06115, partial [Oscillospiraceae bacterium]|nr:hypothetical protein [Oscillospiraceae bacterium]